MVEAAGVEPDPRFKLLMISNTFISHLQHAYNQKDLNFYNQSH